MTHTCESPILIATNLLTVHSCNILSKMFFQLVILSDNTESDEEAAYTLSPDESDSGILSAPENDFDSESLAAWRIDEVHDLNLVMVDHDLIFEAVDSAFYEAPTHDRGIISQLIFVKLCQLRLCCRCCAIYRFGVLCYSTCRLMDIVDDAVQSGIGRTSIVRNIEDAGDPHLIDDVKCTCTCCGA